MTVMWLARGFMWRQAGVPVRHAVPREGATSIAFEFGVPRNARNKDAAWRWITSRSTRARRWASRAPWATCRR